MFKLGIILLAVFVILFLAGVAFDISHPIYNRALAATLGFGLFFVGLSALIAAIAAGWDALP